MSGCCRSMRVWPARSNKGCGAFRASSCAHARKEKRVWGNCPKQSDVLWNESGVVVGCLSVINTCAKRCFRFESIEIFEKWSRSVAHVEVDIPRMFSHRYVLCSHAKEKGDGGCATSCLHELIGQSRGLPISSMCDPTQAFFFALKSLHCQINTTDAIFLCNILISLKSIPPEFLLGFSGATGQQSPQFVSAALILVCHWICVLSYPPPPSCRPQNFQLWHCPTWISPLR